MGDERGGVPVECRACTDWRQPCRLPSADHCAVHTRTHWLGAAGIAVRGFREV